VDVSLIPCKVGGLAPTAASSPVLGSVNFCMTRIVDRNELLSEEGLCRHGGPRDLMELMCQDAAASGVQLWV
jgi:hypothetical protein